MSTIHQRHHSSDPHVTLMATTPPQHFAALVSASSVFSIFTQETTTKPTEIDDACKFVYCHFLAFFSAAFEID